MKLIAVHSSIPESHHCEVCDDNFTENLTKWYETDLFLPEFNCTRRKYVLGCCVHKGVVIDWEERISKNR